jgi:hypothetical protein
MTHHEIARMVENLVWLGLDDETIDALVKEVLRVKG